MTDLKTHQRLSKDPLAHLIANTLAEVLFATVMPHRGQAEQNLIARTSLLLADRVRFATGLPKMEDPVDPPSYAADGLAGAGEGKDTGEPGSEVEGIDYHHTQHGPPSTHSGPYDTCLACQSRTQIFAGISVKDIDPTAIRQALTNPEHTWLKDTP